jgi:hypothetical protein
MDLRCQPFPQAVSVAPQVLSRDLLLGETSSGDGEPESASVSEIERL